MADISSLIEQIRAGLDAATAGQWTWGQKYVCHKDGWDYTRLFNTPDDKQAPEGSQWERDATHVANCCPDNIRRLLEHIAELEARTEWRDIESAPKDEEVLVAYWRWRNSMSPGSVVVQSAMLTEHHGKGIWSWVVSDNKHGPFPLRGYCEGDLIGWLPLPSAPGGRDNA